MITVGSSCSHCPDSVQTLKLVFLPQVSPQCQFSPGLVSVLCLVLPLCHHLCANMFLTLKRLDPRKQELAWLSTCQCFLERQSVISEQRFTKQLVCPWIRWVLLLLYQIFICWCQFSKLVKLHTSNQLFSNTDKNSLSWLIQASFSVLSLRDDSLSVTYSCRFSKQTHHHVLNVLCWISVSVFFSGHSLQKDWVRCGMKWWKMRRLHSTEKNQLTQVWPTDPSISYPLSCLKRFTECCQLLMKACCILTPCLRMICEQVTAFRWMSDMGWEKNCICLFLLNFPF